MYYDYDLAAPAMAAAYSGKRSEDMNILILGNGTGTYASECVKYFPGCTVEGVEIDGKITRLAEEIFEMPDSVRVYEYDGRAFLSATDKKYDVIMVDAYQDITIPFHMSTVEFFTLVRDRLAPGGVMVVNMNMHSDGEGAINQYLTDTILSVFPYAAELDVQSYSGRELFASADAYPAETLAKAEPASELKSLLSRVSERLRPSAASGKSLILTDDRSPVELLGMKMIDGIIAEEMSYFKDVFREKGIKGIIDAVS